MNWKKILPHVAAIIILIIVSLIYFSPILENKIVPQSDMMAYPGISKALDDYKKISGKGSEWAPNLFSGMPSYQIKYGHKGNIFDNLIQIVTLGDSTNTMGVFFLLALGFYLFMVCLGFNPWMSLFAGLVYALGSYNIILIDVGHITKAWAMGMIAPILGGMILVFQKKYIKGFVLFTVCLAFQLTFNHIQITYYTIIAAVFIGISYLVFAIKDKDYKDFTKSFACLVLGAVLAFIPVSGHIMINNEYVKHTMRGGSELTIRPQNNKNDINSKGLDIKYAFNWSYGKDETMTILIPDYMGGGYADSRVGKENSKILQNRMQAFQQQRPIEQDQNKVQQVANQYLGSSYYGEQPFTAGPVYFGSIVVFLCLLGFLILDNKWRWWLLAATIISIMLSWGSNLMSFNSWIFNHLPMYNKFRTPSMALVIANVTMCIAAFVGLNTYLKQEPCKKKTRALYYSSIFLGGITLLAAIAPTLFSDFSCTKDAQFAKTLGDNFISALQADREAMFVSDARRSFIFILIAFLTLLLYNRGKIEKHIIVICIIGFAAIIDLWGIDKRYINKDTFKPKSELAFIATTAENNIMQQTENNKITHSRVYNLAANTFNEAKTSYFMPSIGGYSAAKLQRYQDIIDFYLTNTSYKQMDLEDTSLLRKNPVRQLFYQYKDLQGFPMPNIGVLNMLDTRFIILSDEQYVENTEAMGAAWFAKNIKWANNADEEISALDNFNPKQTVVINKEFKNIVNQVNNAQDSAKIKLTNADEHDITHLKYATSSSTDQIAVFSEIYYKDSWHCYLDGKEVPYFRANYVLRGLYVPAGKHTIEFICNSDTLAKGNIISYIGSILIIISIALAVALQIIKNRKQKSIAKQ